jgi:YggT family protein
VIAETAASMIRVALMVINLLIIIRVVLSFLPQFDRGHPLVGILDSLTGPILRPFQRLLPGMGGLDFSPVIAILTLQFAGDVVIRLLMSVPV